MSRDSGWTLQYQIVLKDMTHFSDLDTFVVLLSESGTTAGVPVSACTHIGGSPCGLPRPRLTHVLLWGFDSSADTFVISHTNESGSEQLSPAWKND